MILVDHHFLFFFWYLFGDTINNFTSLTADYSLTCQPGYRVSKIKRSQKYNGKLGSLIIQCELIEHNAQLVKCARLESVPQCFGIAEGCSGQSWLAGFNLYVIENSTKVTLWDPVCCTSEDTMIHENTCINDRLNEPEENFEHEIADDLVYRGLQCWHQYNTDNALFDLIWKMEICPFSSSTETPYRLQDCPECECDCGKSVCPDTSYPSKLIHKHSENQSCQCQCDCITIC
uniref:4Fe-4S ferredoxin-type domain-containing protein n=1 Tax=Setaria digitata TaxID=48799 RepID=A0A915PNQ3_9BILA